MRRVLIGANVFKLSAPGYDAATAAPSQLVFDGFAGVPYIGAYLAGLFPSTSMVAISGGYQGTVNFGRTFAAPPGCVVRMVSTHTGHALTGSYSANPVQGRSVSVITTVSTTQLIVKVLGSGFATQVGFSYLIMQV